jgi:hypothetical protein
MAYDVTPPHPSKAETEGAEKPKPSLSDQICDIIIEREISHVDPGHIYFNPWEKQDMRPGICRILRRGDLKALMAYESYNSEIQGEHLNDQMVDKVLLAFFKVQGEQYFRNSVGELPKSYFEPETAKGIPVDLIDYQGELDVMALKDSNYEQRLPIVQAVFNNSVLPFVRIGYQSISGWGSPRGSSEVIAEKRDATFDFIEDTITRNPEMLQALPSEALCASVALFSRLFKEPEQLERVEQLKRFIVEICGALMRDSSADESYRGNASNHFAQAVRYFA